VAYAALRVVEALLVEGGAEPLDGAADDLAVQRFWVDDGAGVVDCGVAQEGDLAGLHVDFDDGDVPGVADERVEDAEVGAVGGRYRRQWVVVGGLRGEAALEIGRQVEAEHVRTERDLAERQLAVGGADDVDRTGAELEVVG